MSEDGSLIARLQYVVNRYIQTVVESQTPSHGSTRLCGYRRTAYGGMILGFPPFKYSETHQGG
jgi:hypothetical protein